MGNHMESFKKTFRFTSITSLSVIPTLRIIKANETIRAKILFETYTYILILPINHLKL